MLARRAAMSTAARTDAGIALVEAVRELVERADRIAAYVSFGTEPPTGGVLALRPDALLPVLRADGDLDWAVADERLARGRHGMLEPTGDRLGVDAVADCDVVLVPSLAVDRTGTRLGRGGGSYDRALRRATGRTVALLYAGELVTELPAEPHDVRVTAVVTPSHGLADLPAG